MEFSNHRSSTIVNKDSREERYFPSNNSHSNPEYFSKKQNSVIPEEKSNQSNMVTKNSDNNPIDQSETITNNQENNGFESVALDSPKRKDTAKKYAPQPEDPDKNTKDDDIYVDVEHLPSTTNNEPSVDEYSGKDVEESDPNDNPSLY